MRLKILHSLLDAGRDRKWLAFRLGISKSTLDRKLADDGNFLWREILLMKELFKWESVE